MHVFFHRPFIGFRFNPTISSASFCSCWFSQSNSIFTNTMSASSLVLPSSISVNKKKLVFGSSEPFKLCNSLGFKNGIRGFSLKNLDKSRVFMSIAVGSQTTVDDALFNDYKPTCAFLFPGQVRLSPNLIKSLIFL